MLARLTIGTQRAILRKKHVDLLGTLAQLEAGAEVDLMNNHIQPINDSLASAETLLSKGEHIGDAMRILANSEDMLTLVHWRLELRKLERANADLYRGMLAQGVHLDSTADAFFRSLPERFADAERSIDQGRRHEVQYVIERYLTEKSELDLYAGP